MDCNKRFESSIIEASIVYNKPIAVGIESYGNHKVYQCDNGKVMILVGYKDNKYPVIWWGNCNCNSKQFTTLTENTKFKTVLGREFYDLYESGHERIIDAIERFKKTKPDYSIHGYNWIY